MTLSLKFVKTYSDIEKNVTIFNRDLQKNRDLDRKLVRSTQYWVYDLNTHFFGPNKFVAYLDMNFANYGDAQKELQCNGEPFNGTQARKAIEKILNSYEKNDRLEEELCSWGEALFGSDIFQGIDKKKENWRFVELRNASSLASNNHGDQFQNIDYAYLPNKEDFESAYRSLTRPGETIAIDSVLDQMEINAKGKGLSLKNNWRIITEKNIEIWSKKK